MKFATDLSKGILGSNDNIELWNIVISNIPDSVLLTPGIRILNVACGHATESVLLAKRMIALGVNTEDVNESIWLIDKYYVFTNPAKKIYGFKNVVTGDFLNWKTEMKFDIVIGNPPYQSGNGEKGGKHSLWRKFVKKSFELVNDNGYVAMVCPGFPYQANDLGKYFTKNTPVVLDNDVSGYFPGIGSEIKYWVVQQGKHNIPFVVDGKIWSHGLTANPTVDPLVISIINKVNKFPKFECIQDKGYNSTQFKNDATDYFETPRGKSCYPIRHASTIKVCYVSSPTAGHNLNKVMMTFSGYPDFEYYDGTTNPISSCYQMSGYIEVTDQLEGEALIKLYKSKFYTFLSSLNGAGMKGVENYCLPKLDLTKKWTDADLYKHFKLTQDEITCVHSNTI